MIMTDEQTTGALGRFSFHWAAFLVAASAIGSLVFACATPFAAVAAVAAMTLPLRAALATSTGVWLANQAVGFGLLAYPVEFTSLAWGVALVAASLAATVAAWWASVRLGGQAEPARWMAAFAAALLAHQAVLFATSLVLGGGEGFTASAVGGIAALNAIWAAGLGLVFRAVSVVLGRGAGGSLTARGT
jgi:hypothetical protein